MSLMERGTVTLVSDSIFVCEKEEQATQPDRALWAQGQKLLELRRVRQPGHCRAQRLHTGRWGEDAAGVKARWRGPGQSRSPRTNLKSAHTGRL